MPSNRVGQSRIALVLVSLATLAGCQGMGAHPTYPLERKSVWTPSTDDLAPAAGPLPAPFNSVCRIVVNRRRALLTTANFTSSGAILTGGWILTAAHNFKSTWLSHPTARSVECGVGSGVPDHPVWTTSDELVQARYPKDFDYHEYEQDFALVRACGAPASAFRLPDQAEVEKLVVRGAEIFVAGYAAEESDGGILFHAKGRITEVRESVFNYDVDTQRGMSGGPVWMSIGDSNVLVGVHVREGGARRITGQMLQQLEEWKAASDMKCRQGS